MAIRMTAPTIAVLAALETSDEPLWGYRICEITGLGPSTVYQILARLTESGWLDRTDEPDTPYDRPQRQFYLLTDTGRQLHAEGLAKRNQQPWRKH